MIGQIARKDILGNLVSLRFVLSLLLVIALAATSGFVFVDEYRLQTQDYRNQANEALAGFRERAGQLYQLAFYQHRTYQKPKPVTFFAEGFEQSLPNSCTFNAFTVQLPEARHQRNFLLPALSNLDWVFLTGLILSFVALLLTYDCVCGEREAGTLGLMLAGSIPRHKVLAAKYLGAMFTVGIPLLVGVLVSLIVVVASRDIVFGGGDWLKILILVVLSFLYLSIFVLLGILVSSRTAHSANSMVMLLLVWVGLVILIPSFGRVIAEVMSTGSSPQDCQRRLRDAYEQVNADYEAGKFGENAGARSPNIAECNPPARAKYINAGTEAENRAIEDCYRRMLAQASAGRNVACLSPTAIYQRAAEAIAGTGICHGVSLSGQIKRYQTELREYIRARDQEDPQSLHLLFDEENSTEEWNAISKKPADFAAVPKFEEQDLTLAESLSVAVWDIGLLVLFNVVVFAAAFASFLKYDVR